MFLKKRKDGGPNSPVDAYFLVELKGFFSIAILKFNKGGREAFHSHAFDALTWFIKGELVEEDVSGDLLEYKRSVRPKVTLKNKNHRVKAVVDSWCFTIRGPWVESWTEYKEDSDQTTFFKHGRSVIKTMSGIHTVKG